MSRSNTINIGQLVLLLGLATVLLWAGDGRGWFFPVREYVEEKILRIRVDHTELPYEEEEQLKSKVVSLEQEVVLLKDENSTLRRQLEAPLPASLSFIPGYVIGITETETDSIMQIAAGEHEGVAVDMPVVTESILIGRVTQVTPKMAHVMLLSSPQSKVAVRTDKGSQGLIVGSHSHGAQTVLLDRVLQNEPLKEGDIIATSGEDGLPVNLLVGTVAHIISEAREPYQRAEVTLSIDPYVTRRVFAVGD